MKKLSARQQRKVIQLFNNLFASGFTLSEMVDFLKKSQLLADQYTSRMHQSLLRGDGMSTMMGELGFSDNVVTQLSLADIHGNTAKSLKKIEEYLTNMLTVRRKLVEVITYPVILLSFLVILMVGLRHYLIPQLESSNIATQIISNFPMIFLVTLISLAAIVGIVVFFAKKLPPISLASKLSQLPFVGTYVRLYLTAYYAREWGNLIGQGIELSQVVQLMQWQRSSLFQAIGRDMEQGFLHGSAFHSQVANYPFFLKELGLMIEYGEVKDKLGEELEIYAEETWELFFNRIQKATQWIQPLIFVFVALTIVMIYAAMLLPMYQNMEI